LGSKKKKGTKAAGKSQVEAVQPDAPDYSKYARARSNKSTINYAELRLARLSDSTDGGGDRQSKKKKGVKAGQEKSVKSRKGKDKKKKTRPAEEKRNSSEWVESFSRNALRSPEVAEAVNKGAAPREVDAEERYNDALGSGDHYSSAIAKFYLKYPEAERKRRHSGNNGAEKVIRKRRRRPDSEEHKKNDRSVAEIAARNKQIPSVAERARRISHHRAKGVVQSTIANQSVYRRKSHRPGALNVLIVAVLLVFISAVCVAVFFNVKNIRVTGQSPYSEAEILRKCTFSKGDNILFIDTRGLEETILRDLPYIEACSVRRSFPSTVTICVSPADLLGVAEIDENTWSILSRKGKIVETDTNIPDVSESDIVGRLTYTPEINSAEDLAGARDMPLLKGVRIKNHVKDGYVSDEIISLIDDFSMIRKAAEKYDMRLTSVNIGSKGYEAEYEGRITIILGDNPDEKTLSHRFHEVYALIFVEKEIAQDRRGEISFYKGKVYFRPEYKISEEETKKLQEQRLDYYRQTLIRFGDIFMTTGDDWFNGKLKDE